MTEDLKLSETPGCFGGREGRESSAYDAPTDEQNMVSTVDGWNERKILAHVGKPIDPPDHSIQSTIILGSFLVAVILYLKTYGVDWPHF